MKSLTLIRHSLTEANERRLYYGRTDLPLSAAGRALCDSLAGTLPAPGGAVYACSDLRRAEETLLRLFHPGSWRRFPALNEMDMGEFEMRGYEELKGLPAYRAWLADTAGTYRIPGGESNNDVRGRVCACVDALAAEPGDALVVVCHGGTIAHAMAHLFPDDPRSFYDWIPGACRGWTVAFERGRAVSYTETGGREGPPPPRDRE